MESFSVCLSPPNKCSFCMEAYKQPLPKLLWEFNQPTHPPACSTLISPGSRASVPPSEMGLHHRQLLLPRKPRTEMYVRAQHNTRRAMLGAESSWWCSHAGGGAVGSSLLPPLCPPGKQCGGGHWGAPLGQVPGPPCKTLGCCKHCRIRFSELFGVPRGMGQRRHKKCHVTRCLGTASRTSYHSISFWRTVNFLCLQIHQKTNIPM